MKRYKSRRKQQRGRGQARIYQIPGHLVPRVDAAAASGEDMAVFVATLFGHLVAKSAAEPNPPIDEDTAIRLSTSVVGVAMGVGIGAAFQNVVGGAKARLGLSSPSSAGTPSTPEELFELMGLADVEVKEAAIILAAGIRSFYGNARSEFGEEKAFDLTKKFVADALANRIFAAEF